MDLSVFLELEKKIVQNNISSYLETTTGFLNFSSHFFESSNSSNSTCSLFIQQNISGCKSRLSSLDLSSSSTASVGSRG